MGTLAKGNTSLHDHLHIITHLRRPHRTELHSMGHLHTQCVVVMMLMCVCVRGCMFAHMLWPNSPSDTCLMVMFRNNHQNDPCAFSLMASHSSSVLNICRLPATHTHTHTHRHTHTHTHTHTLSLSVGITVPGGEIEKLSLSFFPSSLPLSSSLSICMLPIFTSERNEHSQRCTEKIHYVSSL